MEGKTPPLGYVQNTEAKCTNQRNLLYGNAYRIKLPSEGAVIDSQYSGGFALVTVDGL